MNISEIKTGYTHGSVFHSDDVFAAALLLILNPEIKINRINKVTPDMYADDTIVFDIGEGEYDHHQVGKACRPIEDGNYFDKDGILRAIPYCSFGLLWRDFGRQLCPDEQAWKKVDRDLVIAIDKADNGVCGNTLSAMISRMNPVWCEDDSADARMDAFMTAVELTKVFLKRAILDANAEVDAEEAVLNSRVVDGKILVLDKFLPWQNTVIGQMPDILYVVFPSARGGFCVQTVPDAPGSFKGRKLFPKEWLGHPVESMGMFFCHPGNFILSCYEEDQAIDCARFAVGA